MASNTTGSQSTAIGHAALRANTTGQQNTAIGQAALLINGTGSYNTAVGEDALRYTTSSSNIALGRNAGRSHTIGDHNIFIGHQGGGAESNGIFLGTLGVHTRTYVAGIADSTINDADVMVDPATGRLGIPTSSRRFKRDIHDMGSASRALLELRPVTFRRKAAGGELASDRLEFGLIAEEVAETLPELVVRDGDGDPLAVRYHQLAPLLLNEVQRQNRRIQTLSWLVTLLGVSLAGVIVMWKRAG